MVTSFATFLVVAIATAFLVVTIATAFARLLVVLALLYRSTSFTLFLLGLLLLAIL